MKILIVNTFYFPNMIGGTEHSIKLLAEGLAKRGHTVKVLTIDNQNKKINKEIKNNVEIYRLNGKLFSIKYRVCPSKNRLKNLFNRLVEIRNFSIEDDFIDILNDFQPDIIHTNNLYGLSPYIWKIAKSKNVPIVHTLRDYWLLHDDNRIDNFLFGFSKLYYRKLSQYVDFVTGPSDFILQTFYKKEYFKNSKKEVIVNCIDIDLTSLKNILIKRNESNDNIITFIFVGTLNKHKGILNLLKAFSNLQNDNIRLKICGEGNLKNEILIYCDKDYRISYKGQLSKEKLKTEWLESDVCIVPSIWEEPFGRVVIEANQFGLPVIGSNKGGITEIINNIHTGELFQYDDLNDLQNKIQYFSNRENIKQYYKPIINNIMYYSLKNQIDSFMKVYESLL